jgi:hypothetical protein
VDGGGVAFGLVECELDLLAVGGVGECELDLQGQGFVGEAKLVR